MNIQPITMGYHRNGLYGEPFYAVLFQDEDPEASPRLAILFKRKGHCAILDLAKLAAGNVAFGWNSSGADQYEPILRKAIENRRRARTESE